MPILRTHKLDAVIEPALRSVRVPGAAIAIVERGRVVFARGYGYRDLTAQLPMGTDTIFPIASMTKTINATLLGILVEEGKLVWDAPVQRYLPSFRLQDPLASAAVTLRDLVAMRTGLPRHDLVWMGNPINRAELIEAFEHLQLSVGFRERFQYNNLTVALAGHIAEVVSGESWEDLVLKYILEPLHMTGTTFSLPDAGNVARSYHESKDRQLIINCRFDTQLIAPAGGAIHSTIDDMSRWVAFNLTGVTATGRQLIAPKILAELYAPQVMIGDDSIAPSANAAYGLGWAIDSCSGHVRISHGGDLHDVISCVTLFPEVHIGIISFVNLAVPRLARAVNQCAFNVIMGIESDAEIANAMLEYEKKIESTRLRSARAVRVPNTSCSHSLDNYAGVYRHAAYGLVEIRRQGDVLTLVREDLILQMDHWHYDAWIIAENDRFPIYRPHAFERANRIVFETCADGGIVAFSMRPEPATAPVRFEKQQVRLT